MEYLDFETPLKDLEDQLIECKLIGDKSEIDVSETCKKLMDKIKKIKKEIYKNISPWQRVQLSRHPSRPYTLDYIKALTNDTFLELHGDRNIKDDKAMIGGLGKIGDQTFMFIGQQKGYNTKTRQYRNFGMSNPEGYRKAQRLINFANKFSLPVFTFIDTAGAYPGKGAEERGQAEAIAKCIKTSLNSTVPIISVITGEGGSGGAVALATGNKVVMLEHSIYSVISPEGCASILWRSADNYEQAANALKLTAQDLLKLNVIDEIIPEPIGAAHRDHDSIMMSIQNSLRLNLEELNKLKSEELILARKKRFINF